MIIQKHFMVVHLSGNKGFVILTSVLIISVIGVSVSIALIVLGITATQNASILEESSLTRAYSEACAEEALQEIRDNTSFEGTGQLSFSRGTCDYEVVSTGGQNREINVSSISGKSYIDLKIIIDNINPSINVVSWERVLSN